MTLSTYQLLLGPALDTLAACLLLAFLSSPALAKDDGAIGWKLTQTSLLRGDQEISACRYGTKMTSLRGGPTYLFTPPYSHALVWNLHTGKYCAIKMKDFKSPIQKMRNCFEGQTLSAIPLIKAKVGKINGIATVEYNETSKFAKQQEESYRKHEASSRIAKTLQYVVSSQFNLEPSAYRCVSSFYGFPQTNAMPLSLVYYDMDHDRRTQLFTGKITSSKFQAADFVVPKGLKLVANEQKVAETADYNEAIEMMLPGKNK